MKQPPGPPMTLANMRALAKCQTRITKLNSLLNREVRTRTAAC